MGDGYFKSNKKDEMGNIIAPISFVNWYCFEAEHLSLIRRLSVQRPIPVPVSYLRPEFLDK